MHTKIPSLVLQNAVPRGSRDGFDGFDGVGGFGGFGGFRYPGCLFGKIIDWNFLMSFRRTRIKNYTKEGLLKDTKSVLRLPS